MAVSDLVPIIVVLFGVVFAMFNARQKRMDDKLDYLCKMLPAQTVKLASVDQRVAKLEEAAT